MLSAPGSPGADSASKLLLSSLGRYPVIAKPGRLRSPYKYRCLPVILRTAITDVAVKDRSYG